MESLFFLSACESKTVYDISLLIKGSGVCYKVVSLRDGLTQEIIVSDDYKKQIVETSLLWD
jgi:hypothetical protein